ncbi:MAG: DUF881 domain-containing protein [Actinobacteria bacterium]|nr:DUF881 domain-containing protein [Actinomycetota bacterium]
MENNFFTEINLKLKELNLNNTNIKISKAKVSLAVVWSILGILLVTSFYAKQTTQSIPVSSRKQGLIDTIKEQEKQREELKKQLTVLRTQIASYEKKAAADKGVLSSFTKELNELKFATGIAAVKGEGVLITLADSPSVPQDKNPNDYIIHDKDVRIVVNALWAAGAEAIAVNGERIAAPSSVRCAGTTILINSTRLGSPYKIEAIGSQDKIEKGLQDDYDASRLINYYAKTYNLGVTIERKDEIKLPAYKGSLNIDYAKTVEEKDKK